MAWVSIPKHPGPGSGSYASQRGRGVYEGRAPITQKKWNKFDKYFIFSDFDEKFTDVFFHCSKLLFFWFCQIQKCSISEPHKKKCTKAYVRFFFHKQLRAHNFIMGFKALFEPYYYNSKLKPYSYFLFLIFFHYNCCSSKNMDPLSRQGN